jgi:hypothetical protein
MRAIVHSYFGLARVRVNQEYDAPWPYLVDLEKDKSLYRKTG